MDRYGSDMQALQTSSACSCCLDPSCHDSSDLLDTLDGACRQLSPRCRPAYDIAASCCTAMEVAGELVQSGNTSCTGICRHHLGQACTIQDRKRTSRGLYVDTMILYSHSIILQLLRFWTEELQGNGCTSESWCKLDMHMRASSTYMPALQFMCTIISNCTMKPCISWSDGDHVTGYMPHRFLSSGSH